MFAYRYYRSEQAAQRWRDSGIDKPAGWVMGRYKYDKHAAAQQLCDHLIALGINAEVVAVGAFKAMVP